MRSFIGVIWQAARATLSRYLKEEGKVQKEEGRDSNEINARSVARIQAVCEYRPIT